MYADTGDSRGRARFEPRLSVTHLLMGANILVFFAVEILTVHRWLPVYHLFALTVRGLAQRWLWQLVTFQFMHWRLADGGAFHLLADLLVLYAVGRPLESKLDRSRFVGLYLVSGLVGGLCQIVGSLFWPADFGPGVVGASAGCCGLISAYALLLPGRPISIFILPIALPAWMVSWGIALLSMYGMLSPGRSSGIAHAAHLGGLLAGWCLIGAAADRRETSGTGTQAVSPLSATLM